MDEVVVAKKDTSVDFSYQYNLARERLEKKIFKLLCKISKRLSDEDDHTGAIVVLGDFKVDTVGMRRMNMKNVEKYINVTLPSSESEVFKIFESGEDGAIIIDSSGQILATGIFLVVDHPDLDIPEGAGTRHVSAASFSMRDDVMATFTLSEETFEVRVWKDGAFTEQFNPEEDELD